MKSINRKYSILVFGTGSASLKSRFKRNVSILAYVDNNSKLWGQEFNKNIIISPLDIFSYKFDYIYVASSFAFSIIPQLIQLGVSEDKIITKYEDNYIRDIDVILNVKEGNIIEGFIDFVKTVFFKICQNTCVNEKLIMFIPRGKGEYACNPKYILERLIEKQSNMQYVWVVKSKEKEKELSKRFKANKNIKVVYYMSFSYLYFLSKSKYLIQNTWLNCKEKFLPRKETMVIQTWHGAGAFKKVRCPLNKKNTDIYKYILYSAESVKEITAKWFEADEKKLINIGCPRNDILFDKEKHIEIKDKLRKKHNIPDNKKVILYAPTWRDKEGMDNYIDFNNFYSSLKDDFVVLFRFHLNNGEQKINIDNEGKFIIDISKEDDVQEYLILADLLITDYSSIIFDYSILLKPIIFYVPDLEYYEKSRGFYYPFKSFVPGPIYYIEEDVLEYILNNKKDDDNYKKELKKFSNYFIERRDTHSTKRLLDIMEIQ